MLILICFGRDSAEGGAGGALAPHFFARVKINETKNNLTKKFSFTHSSLAPSLENLLRDPCFGIKLADAKAIALFVSLAQTLKCNRF